MSIQIREDDGFYGFKLWHYTPSIAAGVIFTIVFSLLTAGHIWRLVRTKTWFCIPFVVGGIFEILGYIARAASHDNLESLSLYIMQSLLILLAPILFAASVYMILGRIIRSAAATKHSIIRINWLTKLFVTGDVFCFMMQGAGGGLLATAKSQADFTRGENIILGGLILQILIFLVFVSVAVVFHKRLRAMPTAESLHPDLPWQRFMWVLYGVSMLITARNIFRAIEYAMGSDGYLLTHEWTLYVFDALLMSTVLGACLMWYNPNIRKAPMKDFEHGVMNTQEMNTPKR